MEKPIQTAKPAKKTAKTSKTVKKGKSKPEKPARRFYSPDLKDEARDLYQRGVSLERVAKYLAVPFRTLTNWQTADHWTETKNPTATAAELKQRGYKVSEIAARLELSEKTVYKLLAAARNGGA